MLVPSEFTKLCSYFHQDIGLDASVPGEWVAFAQRHLGTEERATVSQFLDVLLNGTYGDAELQKIWHSTDAEIDFPNDRDLREFLGLIRDMTA